MTKKKETYDELLAEAHNTMRKITTDNIPQICRTLRREYDREYVEPDYTDKDQPRTEEEEQKLKEMDVRLRNSYIKTKVMRDMQGILFRDRVFDRYGLRLLPRTGGKRIAKRYVYDKKQKDLLNGVKDVYSKPKDQSPMSKFVEQLIDQEIMTWD